MEWYCHLAQGDVRRRSYGAEFRECSDELAEVKRNEVVDAQFFCFAVIQNRELRE